VVVGECATKTEGVASWVAWCHPLIRVLGTKLLNHGAREHKCLCTRSTTIYYVMTEDYYYVIKSTEYGIITLITTW
jgi:hypothetical protein